METAQWPQEIVVKPIEDIVVTNTCPKPAAPLEKKPRPQKEQALNCPRCHSTNTKFCYYNNYSLTQPRYFCKTCRRYWTEGGSLRNIPVGGGSRKNRRSSSSASSSSSSSNKKIPDLVTAPPSLSQISTQTNPKTHVGQDLNLAFPATTRDFRNISELVQQNSSSRSSSSNNNNSNMSASASSSSSTSTTTNSTASASASRLSALELLTGITSSSRGLNSFMPLPVPVDPNNTSTLYTCGFPQLQDFKPTPNFSLEGIGSSLQSVQETSGRLLFPFEDLKMDQQNNKHQQAGDSTGYWTGMLGGGGSW